MVLLSQEALAVSRPTIQHLNGHSKRYLSICLAFVHFVKHTVYQVSDLTRAVLGVRFYALPLRFFADISKTAARSAAVFGILYSTSFPHRLATCQIQAIKGQVTRSSKVTRPPGKIKHAPLLHQSTDRVQTCRLQSLLRETGYKKMYISDFFYIYDLRSGQFCDLHIISQWETFHFILVCVKTIPSTQNM